MDMETTDFLDGLNAAQREAVTAPLGPTLVLAGAGSGKTRVLVHRMAWLIEAEGVWPRNLMAMTFTNKAATEMRRRIEGLLRQPMSGAWVGTFHGLAHRFLRQHWQEARLPQSFQILDSEDQLRLLRQIQRDLGLEETQWPVRQAQWFVNGRKDEGQRAAEAGALPEDKRVAQWSQIYQIYEQACQRAGVLDFAELLLRALELLRDNDSLLEHYQQRFRHLLVDEFQDTNTIQYRWLQLLAGQDNPIFAVGDDDQAIYGWRGARIENIQNFQRDYPGTQVIRLEQNYRSTANILNAANTLIRCNAERLGKELWTDGETGSPVRVFEAINEQDEARFIASRVNEHTRKGGLYRQCAVLYRSNAQSRVLEETFIAMRIPYRVYGGLRFFERLEIKDTLAYLRLLQNPDDDAAFNRVVNQPPRGIGDKTLELIRHKAQDMASSLVTAALTLVGRDGDLTPRARNAVHGFLQLLTRLRQSVPELELPEQVQRVTVESGLRELFAAEKGEQGRSRLENLDELVGAARGFAQEWAENLDPGYTAAEVNTTLLREFLAHAALEAGEGAANPDEDAVQMMTLHAAKGLEFPLVFITGMEEGLFPNSRALEEPGRLEEERRLAYVGMTRAEQELYLSHANLRRLYGRESYNRRSRFITELPDEHLEFLAGNGVRVAPARRRFQPRAAAMPTVANTTTSTAQGFRIGSRVRHAMFGEGVIVQLEGGGETARAQVRFQSQPAKWLILKFARLEILG